MANKPNPGSNEAVKQGCSCPRLDNRYGSGFIINGRREFCVPSNCGLHRDLYEEYSRRIEDGK